LTVALLFAESALAGSKCCTNTISRDVAVIGGGASGSHAAVWLRDHEKSVVVIEKADQLVSIDYLDLHLGVVELNG
jgi:NADPH-dependent glutamate synthase beta subunit-like oxidoreductase